MRPTGVVVDSCYRQIEFAGILSGTEHEAEARQLIDFMLSDTFQADIPLNMFVYPVTDVDAAGGVRATTAPQPADPYLLDPDVVAEQPRRLDRGVDRHRPAVTPVAASPRGRGRCSPCPVAFLAVFFAVPGGDALVDRPARRTGAGTSARSPTCWRRPSTRRVAWFTLWQAAVSTLATVVVALPAAWVLGRIAVPRPGAVRRRCSSCPFVLPTVVVGTAFLAVLGP